MIGRDGAGSADASEDGRKSPRNMALAPLTIRSDDVTGVATRRLLTLHHHGMIAASPPGLSHALDLTALQAPNVRVWTAWFGKDLAGTGALKILSASQGELKSMRTHPRFLGRGVAKALLEHIIEDARSRGMRRLSLETGSGPAFEPALSLYRRRGFQDGGKFGEYEQNAFNCFLHLDLI